MAWEAVMAAAAAVGENVPLHGGASTEVLGRDGDIDGTSPGVGDGASLDGGDHSMMGVFYPASGRIVVRVGPGPVVASDCMASHARCDKRGVTEDGSSNEITGSIRVADDASRVIVGC